MPRERSSKRACSSCGNLILLAQWKLIEKMIEETFCCPVEFWMGIFMLGSSTAMESLSAFHGEQPKHHIFSWIPLVCSVEMRMFFDGKRLFQICLRTARNGTHISMKIPKELEDTNNRHINTGKKLHHQHEWIESQIFIRRIAQLTNVQIRC